MARRPLPTQITIMRMNAQTLDMRGFSGRTIAMYLKIENFTVGYLSDLVIIYRVRKRNMIS